MHQIEVAANEQILKYKEIIMTKQEMLNVMLKIIKKKEYQPGYPNANGRPSTHCNEAAVEIIETLGFDSRPFLNPKGIGWTNANDMYVNARSATLMGTTLPLYKSLFNWEAVESANHGGVVLVCAFNIIGGSGHVAVVAPQLPPYKKMDCPIVQAGAKNGIFDLKEIFDAPELTPPMFIACKKK